MAETLEFAALTLEAADRRTAARRVLDDARLHRSRLGEEPGGVIPALAAAWQRTTRRSAAAPPF